MSGFNQNERRKGMIGNIIAVIIANYLNFILIKYTNLTIEQSTFLSIYIFGNIIIYSSDILFAKEKFNINEYNGIKNYYGKIPYDDIRTRSQWLLESLYNKYFSRFLLTVIIDSIIGITLLKYSIKQADRLKLFVHCKYRNYIIVFIIAIFTYLLYLSTLRFNWAYNHEENDIMNMLVIIWISLAILIISTKNYSTITERVSATATAKWRHLY